MWRRGKEVAMEPKWTEGEVASGGKGEVWSDREVDAEVEESSVGSVDWT